MKKKTSWRCGGRQGTGWDSPGCGRGRFRYNTPPTLQNSEDYPFNSHKKCLCLGGGSMISTFVLPLWNSVQKGLVESIAHRDQNFTAFNLFSVNNRKGSCKTTIMAKPFAYKYLSSLIKKARKRPEIAAEPVPRGHWPALLWEGQP